MHQKELKRDNIKKIASVKGNDDSQLPLLHFTIKEIDIISLIDSGSSVSLMSPILFNKLKDSGIKIKYLSRQVNIHALNNSVIPFRQCIKIKFKLNKVFTTGTFYIASDTFDRRYNLLLGYDYLQQNKMLLDCHKHTLKFKNMEIPLHYEDNQQVINAIDKKVEYQDNNFKNQDKKNAFNKAKKGRINKKRKKRSFVKKKHISDSS